MQQGQEVQQSWEVPPKSRSPTNVKMSNPCQEVLPARLRSPSIKVKKIFQRKEVTPWSRSHIIFHILSNWLEEEFVSDCDFLTLLKLLKSKRLCLKYETINLKYENMKINIWNIWKKKFDIWKWTSYLEEGINPVLKQFSSCTGRMNTKNARQKSEILHFTLEIWN